MPKFVNDSKPLRNKRSLKQNVILKAINSAIQNNLIIKLNRITVTVKNLN